MNDRDEMSIFNSSNNWLRLTTGTIGQLFAGICNSEEYIKVHARLRVVKCPQLISTVIVKLAVTSRIAIVKVLEIINF